MQKSIYTCMYTDQSAWAGIRCSAHRQSAALNPDPVDKQHVNTVNIVLCPASLSLGYKLANLWAEREKMATCRGRDYTLRQ